MNNLPKPNYSMLQKNLDAAAVRNKLLEQDRETNKFKGIRCPHCNWQPNASSKWSCVDCDFPEFYYKGCFTEWNSFDTKGVCPGCLHRWRWTICLACHNWALHEGWYFEAKEK